MMAPQFSMLLHDDGHYVTYADHVAALAEVRELAHTDSTRAAFADGIYEAIDTVSGGFTTLINEPGLSKADRDLVHGYLSGAIENLQALVEEGGYLDRYEQGQRDALAVAEQTLNPDVYLSLIFAIEGVEGDSDE
jgi:hypothetical protein